MERLEQLLTAVVVLLVLAFVVDVLVECARLWIATDAGSRWVEKHRGTRGERHDSKLPRR